jgi:hypothetical protein
MDLASIQRIGGPKANLLDLMQDMANAARSRLSNSSKTFGVHITE